MATSRGQDVPGIIISQDYGSFTTEDYERVGREADEAIAEKAATKSPVAEAIPMEAGSRSPIAEALPLEAGAKSPLAEALPMKDDCQAGVATLVPHEYNKRVMKLGKFKRSPFIDYENKKQFALSQGINEIYDDVCKNGWRSSSTKKSQKNIDIGTFYIHLGDLAESVKPMGSLHNCIAEIAIIVLFVDSKDNLKKIFPARLGGYLLDSQLDKNDFKQHFDCKSADRLDHKQLVLFPILQELGEGKDKVGHWFVVCLNLKAERFDVYDSLREDDDEVLVSASNLVIASIKIM